MPPSRFVAPRLASLLTCLLWRRSASLLQLRRPDVAHRHSWSTSVSASLGLQRRLRARDECFDALSGSYLDGRFRRLPRLVMPRVCVSAHLPPRAPRCGRLRGRLRARAECDDALSCAVLGPPLFSAPLGDTFGTPASRSRRSRGGVRSCALYLDGGSGEHRFSLSAVASAPPLSACDEQRRGRTWT